MQKILEVGTEIKIKIGIEKAESRHDIAFRRVDSDGMYAMAQFCCERSERLSKRHCDFIEGMVELAGEPELIVKQASYLRSLCRQLGGQ
jgi:hypothetical protein